MKQPRYFKILKQICKFYDAKFIFDKKYNGAGAFRSKRIIRVGYGKSKYTRAWIISAVFHELGHFYCYEHNKYPIYHNPRKQSYSNYMKSQFKKTMVRAEMYVDKIGESLSKEWIGENFEYKKGYTNKEKDRRFLTKHYRYTLDPKRKAWATNKENK